jgi:hypothetical protein
MTFSFNSRTGHVEIDIPNNAFAGGAASKTHFRPATRCRRLVSNRSPRPDGMRIHVGQFLRENEKKHPLWPPVIGNPRRCRASDIGMCRDFARVESIRSKAFA